MSVRRLSAALIAVLAGWGGVPASAQPEDLTRGKTPTQLFASDCADCHRNPRGLAKSDARSLAGFLRVHYTASKESAAAIAEYLVSLGAGSPQRASPRPAPSAAKPPVPREPSKEPPSQTAAPAAKPSEASAPRPPEPASEPKPASAAAPPETPAAVSAPPPAPAPAAPASPPAASPQ